MRLIKFQWPKTVFPCQRPLKPAAINSACRILEKRLLLTQNPYTVLKRQSERPHFVKIMRFQTHFGFMNLRSEMDGF